MITLGCPRCHSTLRERGVNFKPGVEIVAGQPGKPIITDASIEVPINGIEFFCPNQTCGFKIFAGGPQAMMEVIASCEYAGRMIRAIQRIQRRAGESN